MLYALIPPQWLRDIDPTVRNLQLDCTLEEALEYNEIGYNLYSYANSPKPGAITDLSQFVTAKDIDQFDWIFMDLDMKDYLSTDLNRRHEYATKDAVVERLLSDSILPGRIVDSGGGIHAYWRVCDLDAKSYLRLQRRLARHFKSDPAVSMLKQLMRVAGSINMKYLENPRPCLTLYEDLETIYDSETFDKWLPPITPEDEEFINRHYDSVHELEGPRLAISDTLPPRFLTLCRQDKDINHLYFGQHKDRSGADFRLGLELFNHGFTREEAMAVLSRTAKASERSKAHQYTYAEGIVQRVWDVAEKEVEAEKTKKTKFPIRSAADVESLESTQGARIRCSPLIDATKAGFRRGQVLGLIGATGNGKSSFTLNVLRWFAELNTNQNLIYLYVTLEMTEKEVQGKWKKMVKGLKLLRPDVDWDRLIYFLGNFNDDGTHRELGVDEIAEHAKELEELTGQKVGAIAVDHIGILKQTRSSKTDEREGLIGVAKQMKPLAARTDSFVIIQSQTSRSNGATGDVELDVSSAFGISAFEWYCDFILTIWQPLRKAYGRMDQDKKLCVTAFKMAKTRDKNVLEDDLQTDTPYGLAYSPETEIFREMTSDEEKAYEFWNRQATTLRNQDKKKDPSTLATITWVATKIQKDSNV